MSGTKPRPGAEKTKELNPAYLGVSGGLLPRVLPTAVTIRDEQAAIARPLPAVSLMGWAAAAAVEKIVEHSPGLRRAVVLAGPGNNGGDALAVAWLLLARGIRVQLWHAFQKKDGVKIVLAPENGRTPADYQSPADYYARLLTTAPALISAPSVDPILAEGTDWSEKSSRKKVLKPAARAMKDFLRSKNPPENKTAPESILIDGLLGTGFRPPLRPTGLALVELLNRLAATTGCPIHSLDLPSGISGDGNYAPGEFTRARYVSCFHALKPAVFVWPLKESLERVWQLPIGIPHLPADSTVRFSGGPMEMASHLKQKSGHLLPGTRTILPFADEKDLKQWFARQRKSPDLRRSPTGHKYKNGALFLWAGQEDTSGAFQLAQNAFFALGGGIISAPAAGQKQKRERLKTAPHIIQLDWEKIRERPDWPLTKPYQTAALGPGIDPADAATPSRLDRVIDWFCQPEGPRNLVVDASLVPLLARRAGSLGKRVSEGRLLLTPHGGEFERLWQAVLERETGGEFADAWRDLAALPHLSLTQKAQVLANHLRAHILLKGPVTYYIRPGKILFWPWSGPRLAVAGSGDVLVGLVSFYLSRGLAVKKAVKLALGWQWFLSRQPLRHARDMLDILARS